MFHVHGDDAQTDKIEAGRSIKAKAQAGTGTACGFSMLK
jgi:hypothetical protein